MNDDGEIGSRTLKDIVFQCGSVSEESDFLQTPQIGEGLFGEVADVHRYLQVRQAIATPKGGFTDPRNGGGKVNGGEEFALVKGEVVDRFQLIGQDDPGEIEAVDEGAWSEGGDGGGNRELAYGVACRDHKKGGHISAVEGVLNGDEIGVVGGDGEVLELGAIVKGSGGEIGEGATDGDGGEVEALGKGPLVERGDLIG